MYLLLFVISAFCVCTVHIWEQQQKKKKKKKKKKENNKKHLSSIGIVCHNVCNASAFTKIQPEHDPPTTLPREYVSDTHTHTTVC